MSTINSSGLIISSEAELQTEVIDKLKSFLGDSLYVADDSLLGVLSAHMADVGATALQIIQSLVQAFDVTKSNGVFLDNAVRFLGLTRNEATQSRVTLTLGGTSGTVIPAGSLVSDADNLYQWATVSPVTLASSTGTTDALCTTYGPITAGAVTLTVIQTPIYGWDTVTNASAAAPGNDQETDGELRNRFLIASDSARGSSSLPTLYLRLSELDNMTKVQVFQNKTLVTDGDGVPPGYIRVVFVGASNADVAQTIFETTDAETFGTTTVAHYDADLQQSFDINITPATATTLYLSTSIETDTTYANDQATLKTQLQAYIDGIQIGGEVSINKLISIVGSTNGVTDVTTLKVDTSFPASGTSNIQIDRDKYATLSTANIVITEV